MRRNIQRNLAWIVMIAALLAAISLFNGLVSMAHGGPEDRSASHWLMFQRVGWQALALVFILLALFEKLG